jgi:hypothetical protein
MAKKKPAPTKIASIRHKDKRKNIPTEELRDFVAQDEHAPRSVLYPRDPSLDPQLVWKGKDEQDRADLAVPVVPIYIQEKIHPQVIIDALPRIEKAGDQPDLFADFNGLPAEFDQRIDFYKHDGHWSNRMILGDSLLVMTSLAEKEGLKGKVQTIYLDPPYGIKFGSNWQVSTRKRDVKDGKAEDATRQPEQVRAFRDTWQLGIHSNPQIAQINADSDKKNLRKSAKSADETSADEESAVVRRAAICIGPEHGTVGALLIKEAAKEAVKGVGFDVLIVCGFAFDPAVSEEAKRYGKLVVLPAKMNPDLAMGEELLKKTGAGNLFMVFGEPDVEIRQKDGHVVVEIKGVDVYDPTTGALRNSSTDDIACWFIDTDYNGESFFVRHAYFTGADEPYDKLKRALRADIDEAAWSSLYSTVSRPFDKPESGKIAVKVINHYGDEVLKVYPVQTKKRK